MLVLSTLPHFLCILPVLHLHGYVGVILLSTTLSILYHLNEESNAWINRLDHIMALVWFLYDVQLGLHYSVLWPVLEANLVAFFSTSDYLGPIISIVCGILRMPISVGMFPHCLRRNDFATHA